MPQATAAATIPGDLSQLEAQAAEVLEPRVPRLHPRRGGEHGHDARQRRGVPALEDQAAQGPQAGEGRSLHHRPRDAHARAGPLRAGRGADARAPGRRPRQCPRGGRARAHVRALDAGRLPDGGGGGGQRRRLALVPALLAHGRRAGGVLPAPCQGGRLHPPGDHARHDAARLAAARPRPRVLALPREQGHRELHERPGLPAADWPRRQRSPRCRPASRSRASSRTRA